MLPKPSILMSYLLGSLVAAFGCSSASLPHGTQSCKKGKATDGSMFDTCRDTAIKCRSGDEVYVSVTMKGNGSVYGAARCADIVADCTARARVFPNDSCSDIEKPSSQGDLICNVSVGTILGASPRSYTVECGVL